MNFALRNNLIVNMGHPTDSIGLCTSNAGKPRYIFHIEYNLETL